MTTNSSPHDEADGPTLQAVLDAVIARNDSFDRLSLILAENTAELKRTQNLMDTRPIKEDVAYHRRKAFAGVAILAFLVIFLHDQHVENCGPGARAEAVIDAVADNRLTDFPMIVEAVKQSGAPEFCDVTFPLHTHDESGWPSRGNLLGLLIYVLTGLGLWGWVHAAKRRWDAALARERSSQPRNRREGDRTTQTTL